MSIVALLGGIGTACSRFPKASFEVDLCDGSTYRPERALVPLFDYAALHYGATVAEAGDRCKTAGDKAACDARVAAVVPDETAQFGSRVRVARYLVLTRGDDVYVLPSKGASGRVLLAPFDDVQRAGVLAYLDHGKTPMCGQKNAARVEGGSLLLLANNAGCTGGSDDVVKVDARSGALTIVEERRHKQECVGSVAATSDSRTASLAD